MNCTVEARRRVSRCARAVEDIPTVVCADVFAPQESTERGWTVEILVDADGIPAAATREIALAGLELRSAGPYNGLFRLVAVAP
jgi:hypothetical protein